MLSEEVGSSHQTVLWQYKTNAEFWEAGRIQYELVEKYKLIMTAVRGDEGQGYVAIDDFSFKIDAEVCETMPSEAVPNPTNAPTNAPTDASTNAPDKFPDCSFQENTCGWTRDESQNLVWMRTQVSDLTIIQH